MAFGSHTLSALNHWCTFLDYFIQNHFIYHDLQEEIQRGQMIFQNNKSFSDSFPWDILSNSGVNNFFSCAPRYIQVRWKEKEVENFDSQK